MKFIGSALCGLKKCAARFRSYYSQKNLSGSTVEKLIPMQNFIFLMNALIFIVKFLKCRLFAVFTPYKRSKKIRVRQGRGLKLSTADGLKNIESQYLNEKFILCFARNVNKAEFFDRSPFNRMIFYEEALKFVFIRQKNSYLCGLFL
jgi:hypothetical protein